MMEGLQMFEVQLVHILGLDITIKSLGQGANLHQLGTISQLGNSQTASSAGATVLIA